jgi:DNA-binding winged helix-turn-helix (wHTH) protein
VRLTFEGFEIDPAECRVLRAGHEVPLEPRALDMLVYLASRPGKLVRKEELMAEVWQAKSLSDGVLANTVAKLRKALGQSAHEAAPIETVRGRGYRWHAGMRSAPAPSATTQAALGTLLGDKLIGRDHVVAKLDELLDRAAAGGGGLLVLRGAAGMGKTRLLRELATRARGRQFSVWQGAAYDALGAPPYWPWVEVLRAAADELTPRVLSTYLPAHAAALPRLVPELLQGDQPGTRGAPGAPSDPQLLRFCIADELTRLLDAASRETPRAILLDDLHWADAASVELLAHAASALVQRPVILVACVRERAGALDPPRQASLRRLSRSATIVTLRGLPKEHVAELVSVLTGSRAPGHAHSAALFERTGGNPYLIRQLVELVREPPGDAPAQDGVGATATLLPAAVRDVLRQRTEPLEPEARQLLAAASVIGTEFDAALLAELVELPVPRVLAALEPACALGLLARHPSIPQRLLFDHALLRDTLYDELGLAQSGVLHGKLVHALRARGADIDARQLLAIAHHALAAAPFELAACLELCARAASAARETGGFEAAAQLGAQALQRLSAQGGDPYQRCALSLQLGFDRYCAGDIKQAWSTLQQCAQLALSLGYPELLARSTFRLLDCLEAGSGDEGSARWFVEQALVSVGEQRPDLRAVLLAHRAELALHLPLAQRRAWLAEAERLCEQCAPPELRLEVATCGANLRHPTELALNREASERLLALLERHPDVGTQARRSMQQASAIVARYLCSLSEGDLTAADRDAREARGAQGRGALVLVRLVPEMMAAGRALGDGRLEVLEQHVERVRELASQLSGRINHAWLYYTLLLADAHGRGQALPSWLPTDPTVVGTSAFDARGLIAWAWVKTRAGEHELGRSVLAQVEQSELATMPALYGDLGTMCQLAETLHLLSDQAGCARLYPMLAPYAERNAVGPVFDYHGSVAHYLALLRWTVCSSPPASGPSAGEHAQIEAYLARAEQMNEHLRMPLQLGRTRAVRARLLTGKRVPRAHAPDEPS